MSQIIQNIPLLASLDHINFMLLSPYNDVVDGDVDELDKEPDESHQPEPNGCGNRDFLEFFPVWLGAPLDQSDRVLAELFEGLQLSGDLIHDLGF